MILLEKVPFKPVRLIMLNSFALLNPPDANTSISIRKASTKDIKLFDIPDFKRDLFYKRMKSNELCLLAMIDNDIAGYEWFTFDGNHLEERFEIPLEIPDAFLYAYDAYVFPDYRRRGVLKCLIAYSFTLMNNYSKSGVFSFIDYGNDVSEAAHKKLGFTKEDMFIYIKVRGFKYFCINIIKAKN